MQEIQIKTVTTPGGVTVAIPVPTGVPQTRDEFNALINKRGELSDQLSSAANRRRSLAEQLKTADPSARAGIEARLKVLDDRIVRLESEIDRAGDLVANAPLNVSTRQQVDVPQLVDRISGDLVPIAAIVSVFVLLPFTVAIARFIWKRAVPPARPAVDHATTQRLEQMQQAIDTIAIEIERISEGQRFMTKMMNDGRAIGAGPAEPLRSPLKATFSSDRG